MNADSLTGMAVVSTGDAQKLGTVADLLFRLDPLGVDAIKVDTASGELSIPFAKVESVGPDAIMVASNDAAQAAFGPVELSLLTTSQLHALKVVDESGTLLGTVASADIDVDGRVSRLTTTRGGVLGHGAETHTIEAAAIRTVSPTMITVAEGGLLPDGPSTP